MTENVAAVTGGSSGIGRAICRRLAEEGFAVAVLDIHDEPREDGDPTHELIQEDGGEAIFIETDVTEYTAIEDALERIIEEYDSIDLFVNNAGIIRTGSVESIAEQDWQDTIDVNLTGVFHGTKAAAKRMEEGGKIINIASGAGKKGYPGYGAYSASKFGVIGLTEAAAHDLADEGIHVDAVCPGMTATAMTGFRGVPPEDVAETVMQVYKSNDSGQAVDVR